MGTEPLDLDSDPVGFRSWGLGSDGELMVDENPNPSLPRVHGQDILAWHSVDVEELREEFARPWRIVGAIRPTSATLVSGVGFRCWNAEVVALARSPLWGEHELRAAERATQRYEAPLVEFDRLATVASDHGSPVPEEVRPPPDAAPPAEASEPPGAVDTPAAVPSLAVDGSTLSRPPEPRADFPEQQTGATTTLSAGFELEGHGRWTWLAYGAALIAFGMGIWLLARSDWLVLSFLLLALAAAAIAAGSGDRLEVAVRSAGAGFLGALLHIVAADVSDNSATPDLFGVLVIVWLMVATSFACAVAAVVSRAPASASGKLTALTSIALPLASAFAAGLLALPAAFCAAVVAMVQLLCLVLWRRILQRELGPASGAR